MKTHKYKFKVDYTEDKEGNAQDKSINFDMQTHDEIFAVIEKMGAKFELDDEVVKRAFTALKLFGETMDANSDHPFFKAVKPHFMQIRKIVKGGVE
ncbi:DUF3861 family protein [Campylobacter curvus]|uniref:DUF3861 family protein n=1 Tax=Campylobacter curvus TaxID=200 RepID=UPI00147032C9